MKTTKRLIALLFAIVFCLSATVVASAADVNTVDGAILEFEPLQGDVNIDGFLNLKDLVRYKKTLAGVDGAEIDTEVAEFDGEDGNTAGDLVGLQTAIIEKLFG